MKPLNTYQQDELAIIISLLKKNTNPETWEYSLLNSCDFNLLKGVPITGKQLFYVQKIAREKWMSANVEQELKRYTKIK